MKLVFLSGTSASFELENRSVYRTEHAYTVLLNGTAVLESESRNVFSLYGLQPETEYTVEAMGQSVSFTTCPVTVTLNVRDFNALGDGEADDTQALQAAILCCPKDGRVLIPAGIYRTKPLFLKSDISVELEKGALLLGENERRKYPVLPGRLPMKHGKWDEYYLGTWEGKAESAFASLINGISVENTKIYGLGIIDGNAKNSDWWDNDLVKRLAWRPRGIFLNRCRNIALQGITCRNTASWNQHCFFSKDVSYIDLDLQNPKENYNTDGINPESCENVRILGCRFSVGDDCVAVKSGKEEMGTKLHTPCHNIRVRNCRMEFGHGGVTIGSETGAGIHDVEISQCLFRHTDRGIRVKTQRGRGKYSCVKDIRVENIRMENVQAPVIINMFYKARVDAPDTGYKYNFGMVPVDEQTPYIGGIHLKDIDAADAEWAAAVFWGLPEQPIENVTMENIHFSMKPDAKPGAAVMTLNSPMYCRAGIRCKNIKGLVLDGITVDGADGEPVVLENAQQVQYGRNEEKEQQS